MCPSVLAGTIFARLEEFGIEFGLGFRAKCVLFWVFHSSRIGEMMVIFISTTGNEFEMHKLWNYGYLVGYSIWFDGSC